MGKMHKGIYKRDEVKDNNEVKVVISNDRIESNKTIVSIT